MTTRKTVTTETVETGAATATAEKTTTKKADDEIVLTGEGQTIEDDLIAELLAAGLEEEITYVVKCVSPASKAGHCQTYAKGELSLDRIREDWGAGTYTIVAKDANSRYLKRVTQKIAEPAKTAIVAPSQTTQLAEMAQILRSNQPAVAAPGPDLAVILVGMMKAQSDLISAVMNRPAPVPPPAPDPLAMITAVAALFKPDKKESDGITLLLKGLELGREFQGGADWPSIASKGLDTVVPLLGELVKGRQAQAPAPRPMSARPVAPRPRPALGAAPAPTAPPAEGPTQTETETEGEPNMLQKLDWLTRQAKVLTIQAMGEKDPALYAEVFLDNLPEFFTLAEVHEALLKPDAVDQLGRLHAPVLEHREWFDEFRKECLAMIADEGVTDEDALGEKERDEVEVSQRNQLEEPGDIPHG